MLRSRGRTALLAALVLGLAAPSCEVAGVHVLALAPTAEARVWERFETVGFVWPDVANPCDPAAVSVVGEFEGPGGETLVRPAFVYRPYRRSLVGGFEKLAPTQRTYWKVRMTPTVPGTWRWRWVATLPSGTDATEWRTVEVAPPAAGRHGFLRRSPADDRYLRFDDGAPYFAIGENLAWYDGRGTHAYDDWFAKLAAQGVNFVRLWMPSWAFGLEWIRRDGGGALVSTSLGNYTDRLDRAWQLDHVLEAAERHGIYVMLCLQNHGPFSLDANSEWADNPYNRANGGPLAHPAEFFTDAAARDLFRRRLRYVVARWGHSPNVLSFELWNEVDLAEQPPGSALLDWHTEMAQELRSLDPYDHLISTSTAFPISQALWLLPALDLTNLHFYAWYEGFGAPFASDFSALAPIFLARRAPGRPGLLAEIGVHAAGPGETTAVDPDAIGFHDGLWGGLFGEGFGTGMTWWWDNVIDPGDLYFHFGPVAEVTRGVAFDREGFVAGGASASAPGKALRGLALRGPTDTLAGVKNVAHQWYPAGSAHPETISGGTLQLTGLSDGAWWVRWIDAYGAGELASEEVVVSGGNAQLAVPDFSRDVALRMERTDVDPPAAD